ncbi:MAG: histone deacetylase [Deltaproteobacteria bacterium]|nr:histone deacetylase [Deltaproteobacteria bacterium]
MNERFYLVYGKDYSIEGREGFSSTLDLNKARKIRHELIREGLVSEEKFIDPGPISIEELSEVHSPDYIHRLVENPSFFFTLSGLDLLISPGIEELLKYFDPQAHFFSIVNGTKVAALLAWERKCTTINLGGGFHHAGVVAGKDMYGGYCVLADVPVAVHHLRKTYPEARKVLMIDCDQHCGDGNTFTFEDDDTVFTFSIHQNQYFRPRPKRNNLDIPTGRNPGTRQYLSLLQSGLKEVYSRFSPDIVFYIEGVDPYINDFGGGMGISKEGLLRRDKMVYETVMERKLPFVITLGGGYGPEAWENHYQFIADIIRSSKLH